MSTQTFEYDRKVKSFVDKIIEEAELCVIRKFPQEIEELDKLLKDDRFDLTKVDQMMVDSNVPVPFANSKNSNQANGTPSNKRKRTNSETDNSSGFQVEQLKGGTKVLILPTGSVQSNHHVKELIELIKPKILKLLEYTCKLRMWIISLIPKIEDGNNFGVQIQEDTLEEIKSVESEAASNFGHFSRYYAKRASIVSKICKYPHVNDFRQLLKETDESEILELKLSVAEMKNQYLSLYDLLHKNYDKIKKPKSNNGSIMY